MKKSSLKKEIPLIIEISSKGACTKGGKNLKGLTTVEALARICVNIIIQMAKPERRNSGFLAFIEMLIFEYRNYEDKD